MMILGITVLPSWPEKVRCSEIKPNLWMYVHFQSCFGNFSFRQFVQGSCVGDRPEKCGFVWTKCLYFEHLLCETCFANKNIWPWDVPHNIHIIETGRGELHPLDAILLLKRFASDCSLSQEHDDLQALLNLGTKPKDVVSWLWTWSTPMLFSEPAVIIFPHLKHPILIGAIGFFQTCLCGHGWSSSPWSTALDCPKPEEAPGVLGAGAAAAQEVS